LSPAAWCETVVRAYDAREHWLGRFGQFTSEAAEMKQRAPTKFCPRAV
jgi:hypothetical protein